MGPVPRLLGGRPQRTLVRLLTVLMLTSLPVLAASTFSAPTAQPLQSSLYLPLVHGPPYRIGFLSGRDGYSDIYVMNADGSKPIRLTTTGIFDPPVWSPDGRQIAYVSHQDGYYEIYVMNADGSDQTGLTYTREANWSPLWSPDSRQIAFLSFRDGNGGVYVMNADGSYQNRLTTAVNYVSLAWSPNGRQFAMESGSGTLMSFEIDAMNADDSNLTRLTTNTAADWSPTWSPDSRQIAFNSDRDGNAEIYVMNADGSNPTNLTNNSADDWSPAWSPDGCQLAFVRNFVIFVMDADGSHQTSLADGTSPAWSPDGRQIAFVSTRDGNDEIYVMNADGSDPTNLTRNPASDTDPAWSP